MKFRAFSQHMKPMLIILDYKFYVANEAEIVEWTNRCVPGWSQTGMILNFESEQDRLAFLLRWE